MDGNRRFENGVFVEFTSRRHGKASVKKRGGQELELSGEADQRRRRFGVVNENS